MSKNRVKVGDVTRTARAKSHLKRLQEASGKRVVVDLGAEGSAALDALLTDGYGQTQKQVVSNALIDAKNARGL